MGDIFTSSCLSWGFPPASLFQTSIIPLTRRWVSLGHFNKITSCTSLAPPISHLGEAFGPSRLDDDPWQVNGVYPQDMVV